jgi:hypothetical protein
MQTDGLETKVVVVYIANHMVVIVEQTYHHHTDVGKHGDIIEVDMVVCCVMTHLDIGIT